MDKLHRVGSRQVWRCEQCQFDNSILLDTCEICQAKKPQKFMKIVVQMKEEKSQSTSVTQLKTKSLTCLDVACKTENDLNEIKCKKCGKFLVEGLDDEEQDQKEQKEQKKKLQAAQMVACLQCDFMNDPQNAFCLSCDVKIRKKRIPKKPKVRAPRYKGPNFCQKCNTHRMYTVTGEYQCQCPQPEDLLPLEKNFCNYCFKNLQKGQYDKHIQTCQQRQIFYNKSKSKSFERCTALQIDTMIYMHKKCEKLHFIKQRKIQKRIQKLGYNKKDLENLYHYIVNYAPIIIHMHANTHFQFFVKDTHYRSQFQTSKSSGSLSRSSRIAWEDRMFDKMHHNAKDSERVKYGTMNFTNDPHGVAVCSGYGQSYFLLKQHVRDRCTMTDMDSSSPNSTICTFRFCYHLLCKLSDTEIRAAFQGSKAQQIKSAGVIGAYKQIQIHGPVQFKKDIERVYIHKAEVEMNPNCVKQVQEFCKNNGVDYELFGQIVKHPVGTGLFGSPYTGLGAGFSAPIAPLPGSSFFVGASLPVVGSSGLFGAPGYSTAHLYKPPPIKYTSVSFPYSSKSKKDDKDKKKPDQDYI